MFTNKELRSTLAKMNQPAPLKRANPKYSMRYYMEVRIHNGIRFEWEKVRPAGGTPYEYHSFLEAYRMLRTCYPTFAYGKDARVVDNYGKITDPQKRVVETCNSSRMKINATSATVEELTEILLDWRMVAQIGTILIMERR